MTKNSWIFSDPHFGHKNIIRFKKPDGSFIRPGWKDSAGVLHGFNDDIKYHDEMFIERYNARVKPGDHVYCLGDWGHPLEYAARMNGKIRFIPGNHDDIHRMDHVYKTFDKIYPAWRRKDVSDGFAYPLVFVHMPLHGSSDFPTKRRINVHGHIHEKQIMRPNGQIDPWYINVCVEHTNHEPMHFDELNVIVKDRVRELKALGEIE